MSALRVSSGSMRRVRIAPRVLLVDDDATQLKLGGLRLRDAGFDVEMASGAQEALQMAKIRRPDAVMSDVLMGEVDGFTFCRMLREEPALGNVPIILLSAHYQDAPDQQLALRVGASALVSRTPDFDAELAALRGNLVADSQITVDVPDATFYEQHLRTTANQITRLLGQTRYLEERYRTLFENAHDTISVLTPDGTILEANERWREVMGVPPEDLVGHHIGEYAAPGYVASNIVVYNRSIEKGAGRVEAVPMQRPDGKVIFMEFSITVIEVDSNPLVFAIGHDVTEKILAAQTLAEAEVRYRSLVERIPDVIWTSTEDGVLTFMTANAEDVLGYTAAEMCAEDLATRGARVHPDDHRAVLEAFQKSVESGGLFDIEYRRQRKDGQWIWLRNRGTATYERDGIRYIDGMISDITERKRLEESVRLSQKMEAIGQLTGGIAHDFNNILASILANSHFLIEDLAPHDPRHADAQEIKLAAERAAALTRQLLAFSRRQVLEPTIVDLNVAVQGLERMLQRLIGEDIEFTVLPAADLGSVRVDMGQLEQVIMNLVVNARDAMPTGGKLLIETQNIELDECYAASHIAAVPGSYVMLAVSDTGCGMDAQTQRRIFEPFFTTKELGKGTGLGLSTCYGIVKQSGGYVWVYSEPGRGTTFKIYFPRVDGQPDRVRKVAGNLEVSGTETILLVEDDDRVRNAVSRMLEPKGYQVLVARNGIEATEIVKCHQGPIHLVLSDVVMPDANGPEVVERVRASSTEVRALFMSGYTDHAVLRNGALQAGTNFIQKPFAPETLAKKVREVLDA